MTLAVALVELAEWLVSRGRREQAEPLLAEARALFEPMGATAWLERLGRVGGAAEVPA